MLRCRPIALNWFLLIFIGFLPAACSVSEDPARKLKISVDTSSNHLRNMVLRDFVNQLQAVPGFSARPALYESGQLAKDRDVPKALHWGNIEMAAPAQSKLTRFVPEANLFTLPILYGLPPEVMFALLDGEVGHAVNRAVEKKLGVKILGKNIILGFTSIYTTDKKIRRTADLQGLRIRIPGGSGPIKLFRELGISPLALPFPDVPLALAQGSMNGIQSTHETVVSAKLWEVGIRHCFEDRANLIVYVPMLSLKFWHSLNAPEQDLLSETWEGVVSDARRFAVERQQKARAVLAEAGIECLQPERANLESERGRMASASAELAKTLGLDSQLYGALVREVGQLSGLTGGVQE